MGLVLRFNVEFGCKSLVVYDTTCVYDSCSNKTGWGTPNQTIAQATNAVMEITIPGGTTPIIVDVYPYLPNNTGLGFEIDSDDLSLSEFPVGEWTFKYKVSFDGGATYTEKTCKFLNTCAVEKCLKERVLKIDIKCGCKYDNDTFRMLNLLDGAKENHCKGNYTKADEIVKYLNDVCVNNTNCGCN